MKVNITKNCDFKGRTNNLSPKLSDRKVSFKGGEYTLANLMGFVERQGFFAEFLLIDSLSMIVPRIVIGLNRDKDKTGKINYKAGAEEAGREVLSGPSMFLIPMGVFEGVRRFASAAKVPKKTMKALFENTKELIQEAVDSSFVSDKASFDKKFAEKLFNKAFGGFDLGEEAEKLKNSFVDLLRNSNNKSKFKVNRENFEELILEINNKNKNKTPINPKIIEFGEDLHVRAKDLFEDFRNYSHDVISKISKHNFIEKTVEKSKTEAVNLLENVKKARVSLRFGACVASFLAVGAFLIHLPKIYQVSKISPAEDSAKRASLEKDKGGVNAS